MLSASFTVLLTILLLAAQAPLFGQGFFTSDPIPLEDQFGIELGLQANEFALPSLVDLDGDGDLDLFVNIDTIVTNPNDFLPDNLLYFENTGTNACPSFQGPVSWPFGIPHSFSDLEFVDIDGDGDLDLFSHIWGWYEIYFFENRGSATLPDFTGSSVIVNPFGIDPSEILSASLTFCDMDNDGDYDIFFSGRTLNQFQYQENTGTATDPIFASRQANPFGLALPFTSNELITCDLLDWDCDGDLDILNAVGLTQLELYYYENTGTAENAAFAAGYPTGDLGSARTHGDLDGDGDEEALVFHYYAENTTQNPGCVTQPNAAFSVEPTTENLAYAFTNESTAQSTECDSVQWYWDFGDGSTSDEESPTHVFPEPGDYEVCLIVEDIAGLDTFCTTVGVFSGTAQQFIREGLRLYPNPASTYLYIELVEGASVREPWVEIFDALGQSVKRARFGFAGPAATERIDIAGLPAGMYTVKVTDGARFFVGEFVKAGD